MILAVASNERGIHPTNRRSSQPIRLEAGMLVQMRVNAGLVRAKADAAGKHQCERGSTSLFDNRIIGASCCIDDFYTTGAQRAVPTVLISILCCRIPMLVHDIRARL
jgi:hypothetical protein